MKLFFQYMAIFFNFSQTSSPLRPLQVENCDTNSRLVVDEDDNGTFRLERVKSQLLGTNCVFKYQYLQMFCSQIKQIRLIFTHKAVGRGNETRLQVGEKLNYLI